MLLRIRQLGRTIAIARRLDPAAVDVILGLDDAAVDTRTSGLIAPPPVVDDLGALHESRGDHAHRKLGGTFYTPDALVVPTVRRTLFPLLAELGASESLTICDPAVGGGAFLLAAFRELATNGFTRRRALESLYGVDIDPTAVRVTRLSLWLEAAGPDIDPAELEIRIRCGDSCLGAWSEALPDGDLDSRAARDRLVADWFATADPDRRATPPVGTFHWELEFATVFARGGFDAVIGNPPWDIAKPDSRAFFERVDPGHSTLDKRSATSRQSELLARDADLETRWRMELDRCARLAKWLRRAGSPFVRQSGPGDINLYKPFVELSWRLLRADRGRLGLLVPSGLYTDAGCAALRRMLLDESRWEWLFGFENRRALFPIDNRYKFAAIIAQKGQRTDSVATAFMHVDAADWADAERHALPMSTATIRAASPRSLAILEITSTHTSRIFERLATTSHPFGAELDTSVQLRRELDLTLDAHRFDTRAAWEARDFVPDQNSEWRPRNDVSPNRESLALPLYEGRMIDQFDYSQKGWVDGRGRRARWRELPFGPDKRIEPQYLTAATTLAEVDPRPDLPKIGFMAIASATNRRSMVAASLYRAPCGNSVHTLRGSSVADDLCILAVLNSFVFDFALRTRLGGINLNRFVLAETPMLRPAIRELLATRVAHHVAALSWPHARFAPAWAALGLSLPHEFVWTHEHRTRIRCAIEIEVARAYGIDADDLRWILRDCEHPTASLARPTFTRALDPKAFWRVDREHEADERLTARVLKGFRGD